MSDNTFLGKLADSEKATGLVRKTVAITRREEMIIDLIVQDPRTDYQHISQFLRQAIADLIEYWLQRGIDHRAKEAYNAMRELRFQADQARRRAEIQETLLQIEDELDLATRDGDWETVSRLLRLFDQSLEGAPRPLRRNMRYTFYRSAPIRRAVYALLDAGSADPETLALAQAWSDWFETVETEQ